MRNWFSLFLFSLSTLIAGTCLAQQKHQITVITENDSYISVNNDGYYTNGVKLAYQWARSTPDKKKTHRINNIFAGQNIYTARFSGEIKKEKLDRPITGYLYAGYQNTLYNTSDDLVRWGLTAGTIGDWSMGEQMQKSAHKFMQIYKPTFWELQLNNAWGASIDFAWSPQMPQKKENPKWHFKPVLSASGGTLFNQAGAGAALIFGKMNTNSKTAFWNNHQGSTKADKELFAFIYPTLNYKAYDITVQGGVFNKEPEKIASKLNPLFLQTKLGITYAANKLSFSFIGLYESKQSSTQYDPQIYGSIQVGMMW
ncbi:MAG TPA: DUF2219 family protein [Niabella sp.]|nr:DUF2219 family protein [Niabella sp.]HQW14351.1 DUF2219 family protein [Niabella sp.]HQX18370.1 DUF2219 family protein [Niabella sp.]HQX40138.1 DUF2219 family protein [Niabella sp.]HRB05895.1 DUF2219 family protein [Niabella sp.]